MTTRKHIHEEVFPVSVEELFAILHTPSAIRGWWSAASAIVLAEPGGLWAATWGENEDNPDYTAVAKIKEFDPPKRMLFTDYRYHTAFGPLPFEADFSNEFIVEPHPEGATLRVIQDGFPTDPIADEHFEGCRVGWENTFQGIRDFLSRDFLSRD